MGTSSHALVRLPCTLRSSLVPTKYPAVRAPAADYRIAEVLVLFSSGDSSGLHTPVPYHNLSLTTFSLQVVIVPQQV